jgi:hypothetical protein
MRSVNYLFKNRYINLICLFFTVVLFPAQAIFAEGSKELNANHGGQGLPCFGYYTIRNY